MHCQPVLRVPFPARAFIAFVVIATVSAANLNGSEDCTPLPHLADVGGSGTLRAQGSTTIATGATPTSACSYITAYVRVWLVGVSFQCTTPVLSGTCYDKTEGGNAVTQAYRSAYGTADASSNHWYQVDGDYTNLQSQNITISGGDEPPPDTCWENATCPAPYAPLGCPECDPIVIDTGGKGYRLTSAADGVLFDIDGDGLLEKIAWTEAQAELAFLAIDRDGDGQITSGRELFGNVTMPGVSNGFAALRRMNLATNGGTERGSVSGDDPLFSRLLLWTDRNHNGISEPSELRPSAELLSDIGLAYEEHKRRDDHGNLFKFRGWVHLRTAPGRNRAKTPREDVSRRRYIYDIVFSVD